MENVWGKVRTIVKEHGKEEILFVITTILNESKQLRKVLFT